ncbi:MAG: recombinase XerC, partial [Deltaproteobacteria bacterium]
MAGEKDPREAFIRYLAVERRYSAHTVRAYGSDLEHLGRFLATRFQLDAASCWCEVTEQQLRAFLRGQLDETSRATVSRR